MQIILWLIASIFLGIVFQSFGYFFLLLIGGVAVTVIKDNLSARLVKLQDAHDELQQEVHSIHRVLGETRRLADHLREEVERLKRQQGTPSATSHTAPVRSAPTAPPPEHDLDVAPVAPPVGSAVTQESPTQTQQATSNQPTASLETAPSEADVHTEEQDSSLEPAQSETTTATDLSQETEEAAPSVDEPVSTAEAAQKDTEQVSDSSEQTSTTDDRAVEATQTSGQEALEPAIDAPGADDLVPVDETSDIPEESASKPPFSWEEFIGTKLLSYIGIGILVLGLVSLLTYSITLMGEWGRALIGAGCGSALLVAGFFVEPKIRYQLFGRILMGGGWSVLYFTAYGIHHIKAMKIIEDPLLGTIILAATAGGMLVHSLRYRSESTTAVSLLLSYITLFITPVSLYTHLAGLVLGALVGYFAFRFRWIFTHLAGVVLLYSGYGIWLYFQRPMRPATHGTEYMLAQVFLGVLWLFFLIPDFSPHTSRWKRNLVPLVSFLNLIGVVFVRKITHVTFGTQGSPATALYAGIAIIVLALLMKSRDRIENYRLNGTIGILLCMVGLWCVIPSMAWIALSWLGLAVLTIIYSYRVSERYFRFLGDLTLLSGTMLALHGEWFQKIVRMSYSMGSGEWFLRVQQSALPTKGIAAGWETGVFGAIGALLLFVSGALTALWPIPDDDKPASNTRENLLSGLSVVLMMNALYVVFPDVKGVLAWQALAALLFQYGLLRKKFAIRMYSHFVLFWSVLSGRVLSLPKTHIALSLTIGALLLYLDGFLTFRTHKKERDEVSYSEQVFERVLMYAASASLMVATYLVFSLFTALLSWFGLSALLFAYGFVRKDDIARPLSYLVMLLATVVSFALVSVGEYQVTLLGSWKASRYVIHLLVAVVLSYGHTFFLRMALADQKTTEQIQQEEALLTTFGNAVFFAIGWYTLPKIAIGLAYALFGVLWLQLGFFWKRRYLRIHAGIAFVLSGFWLLTVNMGATGVLHGVARRLLSSVPVLALWGYASQLWMDHHKDDEETPFVLERIMPSILSYMGFVSILVLFYYHAFMSGVGWGVFGLVLLAAAPYFRRQRYAMQAWIAFAMASFSVCNLAVHKSLPVWSYFLSNPALWLGPLLLVLAYALTRRFASQFEDLFAQGATQWASKWLRHIDVLYGWMFCLVALFVLTTILHMRDYSLGWGVAGLVLGSWGLIGRDRNFRWFALGLFGLAVGKILFYDIFRFSTGQKIITFISVGIALLVVSFLYNRFKETFTELLLKE